jgi:hypothetical protein
VLGESLQAPDSTFIPAKAALRCHSSNADRSFKAADEGIIGGHMHRGNAHETSDYNVRTRPYFGRARSVRSVNDASLWLSLCLQGTVAIKPNAEESTRHKKSAATSLTGRDVVGGLDLSETRDLTALVLICNDIRNAACMYSQRFGCQAKGYTTRRAWIASLRTSGGIKATCRRRWARR